MVESMISREWVCLVTFILFLYITLTTTTNDTPCVKIDGAFTCYSENPNPYRLYASKTEYPIVNQDYPKMPNLTGCTAKALYLFSRHAARFPKEKYLTYFDNVLPDVRDKIVNASNEGKVNMCQKDIELLNSWKPTYDPDNVAQLALTGAYEAEKLGERLRQRFPSLLGLPYSPDVFTIEYTARNRTRQTAEDFTRGVFSPKDHSKIDFNRDKENNDVLLFYKRCGKIMSKCKKPNFDKSEYKKFKQSPVQKDVYRSMANRTGLTKISRYEQKNMYRACAFGFALLKNDAWCTVFAPDELKVIEFRADLKQYYIDGYGNPQINLYAPCPVIKYIVDFFKSVVKTGQIKVTLHFSHSGAIKKLFTTFGLFRDHKPLTADKMCEQANRKWRSSYICPFTTNIVLVLYQCNDEYKVVTLHNERPVIIDGCDDYVCPLKKFLDYYEPIGNNCDLEKICYNCKEK